MNLWLNWANKAMYQKSFLDRVLISSGTYLGLVPGVVVGALLRLQDGVVFGADVSQSQRQLVGEHGAIILRVEVQIHQLRGQRDKRFAKIHFLKL